MADTTASNSGANVIDRLKSYVRTQKGYILAAEIILSFIILICYASSHYGGYVVVAVMEMVFAMIIFGIFMMDLDKQFKGISWVWTDLFRAAIGAVVYLITSLICVIRGSGDGALVAGGVFGLLATLVYAYDTYITFQQVKSTRQHTAAATDDGV